MTQTIEAVYEDGVFKPVSAPNGVADHARVTLAVTTHLDAGKPWHLAGSISQEDADEMQAIVRREFGRVESDGWK